MSFVRVRYVGSTNSLFANNAVYDVFGWGVVSSEPWAIVLADDGEFASVDVRSNADWQVESAIATRAIEL